MIDQEFIYQIKKKAVMIGVPILVIIFLILAFNPFVVIQGGEVGVKLTLGEVNEEVLEEGIHFIIPQMQEVVKVDVTIQGFETQSNAPSKNLLQVQSTVILNYRIDPNRAWQVYKQFRNQANRNEILVEQRIIDPLIQGTVKAATGQYKEEELIAKRQEISDEIKEKLETVFKKYNINVLKFTIKDFTFSKRFTDSIERKQQEAQRAQEAQRILERIKIEKEQKITQAQAEAEALRIQKEVISPELIQLRQIEATLKAIEKWDGKMPDVTSGAIPFVDVKSYKK